MQTRIEDMRDRMETVDDAANIFDQAARLIINRAVTEARYEKKIAALKAEYASAVKDVSEQINNMTCNLARFIETHKELFQKPRKIKTALGSFGLQDCSELEVLDEEKLQNVLLERGYEDCYLVMRKLIKPAIRRRIEEGERIQGARIKEGDTAVYKVAPALIEKAKKEGSQK